MPRVTDAYLTERREHILTSAAACFAREGFHRTSMRDVITEAGLSPGAVYHYFRGKHDIIAAISLDAVTAVGEAVRASVGRGQTLPDLVAGLPAAIEALDRADDRTRLAVQAWGEALREPVLGEALHEGVEVVLTALRERVDLARAAGEVSADVDSPAVARVVLGIVQGFILQRAWDPGLSAADYGRGAAAVVGGRLAP
ncbi:TetR/AcrR family transcriptional regulator [Nocardiopsis sp. NRRL B-16309]|uniref:TetR/AcrR family transcriptional regulator n=1 Tax=Nocardiopsis sp. NRRL B-16309 TaxID=1519494 RepID=UPI0006AE74FF|nr:TetR/AcrR family transcriptional regulator [Nocardiopsis sp. NRRL B-16309]KOX20839.1 TetR family transcriptional regulator [Nocardiopsis sp. NRRL B-16309]